MVFALLFASHGLGIIAGQMLNRHLIGTLGALDTLLIGAAVLVGVGLAMTVLAMSGHADVLALIKPQFEVGKGQIERGGRREDRGREGELGEWFDQSWQFTKQIMPLLLGGVLVAGFLLGRPEGEGVVPAQCVTDAVGGIGLFKTGAGLLQYSHDPYFYGWAYFIAINIGFLAQIMVAGGVLDAVGYRLDRLLRRIAPERHRLLRDGTR
jgi:hypothetical protein